MARFSLLLVLADKIPEIFLGLPLCIPKETLEAYGKSVDGHTDGQSLCAQQKPPCGHWAWPARASSVSMCAWVHVDACV